MFTPEQPDLIKPKKASQQIIDKIRTGILTGELAAGEKLPSEPQLIQYFGVSRQTVREALCALENAGLLKIRSGLRGGAFVSEVDLMTASKALSNFLFDKDVTIDHITEIRLVLEPHAIRIAMERMGGDDFQDLQDILDESSAIIGSGGDEGGRLRLLEIAFHARLVKATENHVWILLQNFCENLLWDVKTKLKTKSDFSRDVLEAHTRILRAMRDGDVEKAVNELRQDIVQVQESLSRTMMETQVRLI